jgi:hypothetical protein
MALGILVAAVCQAQTPVTRSTSNKIVLYASVGPDLTWYDVDIEHGTLVNRGAVTLPANVQEAWPHPPSSLARGVEQRRSQLRRPLQRCGIGRQ